jgi:hypothetical protein
VRSFGLPVLLGERPEHGLPGFHVYLLREIGLDFDAPTKAVSGPFQARNI